MLTCGVIIITSGGLRLYYLYCIGPCCKPVHISLLVLLHIIIEGIPYFYAYCFYV